MCRALDPVITVTNDLLSHGAGNLGKSRPHLFQRYTVISQCLAIGQKLAIDQFVRYGGAIANGDVDELLLAKGQSFERAENAILVNCLQVPRHPKPPTAIISTDA